MYKKHYLHLFVGIALVAFVIGSISGLSSDPIVKILLPLIFSLFTAGGAVYVVIANEKHEKKDTPSERANRAKLLGLQLISFSIGFGPGLYCGLYAQIHANEIFFLKYDSVFSNDNFNHELSNDKLDIFSKIKSIDSIVNLMEIDYMMEKAGIEKHNRNKLIENIVNNFNLVDLKKYKANEFKPPADTLKKYYPIIYPDAEIILQAPEVKK